MDEESSQYIEAFLSRTTDLGMSVSITFKEDPLLMENQSLDMKSLVINELTQLEREDLLREQFFILDETAREFTNVYFLISFQQRPGEVHEELAIFVILFARELLTHELVQFLVQLINTLAQGIAEHKTGLDIATDFATIIGVTLPLTTTAFKILHLDKAHHKSEKIPSVTITIGDVSVNVADEDIKDAEHAATNIARKLLKEHPDAKLSTKVNVNSKLIEPPTLPATSQVQLVSTRPAPKSRKKRNKKSF